MFSNIGEYVRRPGSLVYPKRVSAIIQSIFVRPKSDGVAVSCTASEPSFAAALDELADDIRDLRADVHGNPSLRYQHFPTKEKKRSNGAFLSLDDQNMLNALFDEAEAEEEAKAKGDKRDIDDDESDSWEESHASSSFLNGSGQRNPADQPRVSAAHPSETHSQQCSLDIEKLLSSPDATSSAAVESFYLLVSALYDLTGCEDVPRASIASMIEHIRSIHLALECCRPILLDLALKLDFDDSYNISITDEFNEEDKLLNKIRSITQLLDCISETVQRVIDQSELSSGLHCIYVTLLELLNLRTAEVVNADINYALPTQDTEQIESVGRSRFMIYNVVLQAWEAGGMHNIANAITFRQNDKNNYVMNPEVFKEVAKLVLARLEWTPSQIEDSIFDVKGGGLLERTRGSSCEDLGVAEILCGFGDFYNEMGDFDRALDYYDETLNIGTTLLGKKDPFVAEVYILKGVTFHLMKNLKEANSCFNKALSILKKINNDNKYSHDKLNSLLLLFSSVKVDMKQFSDAIDLLCLYLEKNEVQGENDPQVADAMFLRGTLYMNRLMHVEAKMDYEEALKIRSDLYGPDHSSVADVLFAMGSLHHEKENNDDAVSYLYEADRIWNIEEPNPIKEAQTLAILGHLHLRLGLPEVALDVYEKCLKLYCQTLGNKHVKVASIHVALGYTLCHLKRFYEGGIEYTAALTKLSAYCWDDRSKYLIHLYCLLGTAEFNAGRHTTAKMHLDKYVDLHEENEMYQGVQYVETLLILGTISYRGGDFESSSSFLLNAQLSFIKNSLHSERAALGKKLVSTMRSVLLETSKNDRDDSIEDMEASEKSQSNPTVNVNGHKHDNKPQVPRHLFQKKSISSMDASRLDDVKSIASHFHYNSSDYFPSGAETPHHSIREKNDKPLRPSDHMWSLQMGDCAQSMESALKPIEERDKAIMDNQTRRITMQL